MAGLRGPRTPECADGCRLQEERDDHCRPGTCYARLTPTYYWNRDTGNAWYPTPEPDIAGRDL